MCEGSSEASGILGECGGPFEYKSLIKHMRSKESMTSVDDVRDRSPAS
jgi:hypothetical protein